MGRVEDALGFDLDSYSDVSDYDGSEWSISQYSSESAPRPPPRRTGRANGQAAGGGRRSAEPADAAGPSRSRPARSGRPAAEDEERQVSFGQPTGKTDATFFDTLSSYFTEASVSAKGKGKLGKGRAGKGKAGKGKGKRRGGDPGPYRTLKERREAQIRAAAEAAEAVKRAREAFDDEGDYEEADEVSSDELLTWPSRNKMWVPCMVIGGAVIFFSQIVTEDAGPIWLSLSLSLLTFAMAAVGLYAAWKRRTVFARAFYYGQAGLVVFIFCANILYIALWFGSVKKTWCDDVELSGDSCASAERIVFIIWIIFFIFELLFCSCCLYCARAMFVELHQYDAEGRPRVRQNGEPLAETSASFSQPDGGAFV